MIKEAKRKTLFELVDFAVQNSTTAQKITSNSIMIK